ncbi:MAG: hypothetical protein JEZ07_04725 [Phycisphaerae bacterium]|nr:hypothetical protein [Phycisphaerae bacterium]
MKFIFKTLIIVIISAITTLAIMIRYTNIDTKDILAKPEKQPDSYQIVEQVEPATEQTLTTEQPRLRNFDYDKLNEDLQSVSQSLGHFNEMLSSKIAQAKQLKKQQDQ